MSLSFDHVWFQYGSLIRPSVPVFEDFSWELPRGRTVLLGPNGAGKTTLLSLAATTLQPQRGTIRLGSLSARHDRTAWRGEIALMAQGQQPVPGFTALEQVAYAAWLQGVQVRQATSAALAALDRVGLAAEKDQLAASLSGGQLRRVALAQALVRPARVMLLDEPTAGLDPAQRSRFRELIAGLDHDVAVLVSTHQVDDLTELFDTVVVLDHAQVRFEGSTAAFMELAPKGSSRPAEAAYLTLVGAEA
jgi:ABC-2 type transport system ATP-binding protein